MDPKLFPEGQCRLILIGKTGNGKSSTGNTILGFRAFEPQVGINAQTRFGDLKSADYDGIELQVMDTPGLHDTEMSDDVIADRITRSLMAIHPGPHAIILCLSCDQRFTPEEINVVETLKHIFGEGMMSHLIVVMVRKDALEKAGVKFEDQLKKCTELKQLMTAINNRYVLFDNRPELSHKKKKGQMMNLMQLVMVVVTQNGGGYFQHKMSAEMRSAMEMLKEAEMRQLEQDPDMSSQEVYREVRKKPMPLPRMAHFADEEESTELSTSTTDSMIRLKEAQQVSGIRKQFEAQALDQLTSEEMAAKFTLKSKKKPTERRRAAPAQSGSAPTDSFKYEVPDKPGMTMSEKQLLVEEALKRKLAQGVDLTEEQEEELEKTSRSMGKKIREGMAKFKVRALGICRLM